MTRYLADRERGRVRALAQYLELFPGHEEEIAREFLRLRDEERQREDEDPAREEPGRETWIGPYRILGELGRGGRGLVYLASDSKLSRRVALKVLREPREQGVPGERAFREAVQASELGHPGICSIYETGEAEGLGYIAMRLVAGESLARKLERARAERDGGGAARPEVMGLCAVFEKIARALHVAHFAGLVHADLKPGNLMVQPDGEPVILDFGLGGDPTDSSYMAPERLRGQQGERQSDIWSLGVVLYECLTLTRPFVAPTRQGLTRAILGQEPPLLAKRNPEIPKDLEIVVGLALQKEPSRRYRSAVELAGDLRRVRLGEPVHARPPSFFRRLRSFGQRNPAPAASLAVLVLLLTIAWLLNSSERRVEASRRDTAEQRFMELRRFSRSLLGELHESTRDQPGESPARQRIARRARELLDFTRVAAAPHDPEAALEIVVQELQVGDVLGDSDEALYHYRKALDGADRLLASATTEAARLVARRHLARCHDRIGKSLMRKQQPTAALRSYRRALVYLDSKAKV
ncbi:MAG: serine/threonine-protein kinase, partial [Planctomycetota bacterium]